MVKFQEITLQGPEQTICMMASFYYYDQDPSGFCFHVQIRAFVIQTSPGLPNLDMKKNEKNSGRSSKMTPFRKWPTSFNFNTTHI